MNIKIDRWEARQIDRSDKIEQENHQQLQSVSQLVLAVAVSKIYIAFMITRIDDTLFDPSF